MPLCSLDYSLLRQKFLNPISKTVFVSHVDIKGKMKSQLQRRSNRCVLGESSVYVLIF